MKSITISSLHINKNKDAILIFLASLGLYLVLDRASYLLLANLKYYLLRNTNIINDPKVLIRINYLITVTYLLFIIAIIFIFYLIGRSVDLKTRLLSSILSLILGSYIGSLIQILITYGGPLTIDMIIVAFLNIFVQRYFFFIAFTGIAIGYIKARL